MARVWKLRSADPDSHSWLRGWWMGGPQITADELEAEQFPTLQAALEMQDRITSLGDRIPMRVVERDAHEPRVHGTP